MYSEESLHYQKKLELAIDCEEKIIGAILDDQRFLLALPDNFSSEFFYQEVTRVLFEHAKKLIEKDEFSLEKLQDSLVTAKKWNFVGQKNWISRIGGFMDTSSFPFWIEKVIEGYKRRMTAVACEETLHLLTETPSPVEEILAKLEKSINFDLIEPKKEDTQGIKEFFEEHDKHLEDLAKGQSDVCIPSGFKEFDKIFINGFNGGDYIVVGARTGHGKTSFSISLMVNLLRMGHTCMFLSTEMKTLDLGIKVWSYDCGVGLHALKTGSFASHQHEQMMQSRERLQQYNLQLDSSSKYTVAKIKAKVSRYNLQNPDRPVKFLFVDYIQRLAKGNIEFSTNELAKISTELKDMAIEYDLTVVVLSQLNRVSESRNDKQPQLSDLKQSGAIEEDADAAILLFRRDQAFKEQPGYVPNHMATVFLAKQRLGPTGQIDMRFNPNTTGFYPLGPV